MSQTEELVGATAFGKVAGRTAVAAEKLIHGVPRLDDGERAAVSTATAVIGAITRGEVQQRPSRSVGFLVTDGLEALRASGELTEESFKRLKRVHRTLKHIDEGRFARVDQKQLAETRDLFLGFSDWALTQANSLEPVEAGVTWTSSELSFSS